MNSQLYVPQRNLLGRFTGAKDKLLKVWKIAKVSYLVFTLAGAVWGVWLTKQVYQFRCTVNGHNLGYFSRRVECDNAYQNWIDSQQNAIDSHVDQILINNPDL